MISPWLQVNDAFKKISTEVEILFDVGMVDQMVFLSCFLVNHNFDITKTL